MTSKNSENAYKDQLPKLWSLVFVLIIALTFCCFVIGQGLNSGTSVYLVNAGYGAALPGALAFVFSGSAAVCRLFLGPIIDSNKCSLVIICGIVVLIAGTLLTAVASNIPLFVCSRILQGLGFAAATTASATAAANVLPQERLGEGIGYYGLGQALATSVGPAFALWLVGTDPATNLFVGLSLVGIVGFFIALNARYEKKISTLPVTSAYRVRYESSQEEETSSQKSLKELLNIFEPRALPGAIPMTILCPTFGFGIFFVGLYGTTLGYEHAGLFFTVSAISMIAVRLGSKRFMDTVPAIKTFTVAVLCGLVSSAMLYFGAVSEAVFLASGIFYGLVLGISLPLNQSVSVKNTPSERWGATNALFLLCNDLGIGLSGLAWGCINDAFGFQVSIICVIVCQVLSYIAAWVFYPAGDKKWQG